MTFLSSMPSPPSPFVFHAGALAPRWYGLVIAIGMMVAITVTRREFRRQGLPYELVFNLALWTIPAAVLGARAYHVITDWRLFSDDPIRVLAISSGGLGLPGALIGGAIGLLLATRRFGLPVREVLDCIAPGLLCAQVIGRFGNYANQELFGRPTSLPWGIEIDPANRPARFAESPAFHPTFAYEALWNVLVLAFIVRLAGGFRPRRRAGAIFASYLARRPCPIEPPASDPTFLQRALARVATERTDDRDAEHHATTELELPTLLRDRSRNRAQPRAAGRRGHPARHATVASRHARRRCA